MAQVSKRLAAVSIGAVCCMISPGIGALTAGDGNVVSGTRMTDKSRCAKLTCHKLGQRVEDAGPDGPERVRQRVPDFSIVFGVGGAALRDPRSLGVIDAYIYDGEAFPSPLPSPPEAYADGRVVGFPSVSVGVSLQQPLVSLGELALGLEERFSLSALRPIGGSDGSALAGFADFMLGAGLGRFPIGVALGPTLGLVDVEFATPDGFSDADTNRFITGAIALLRLKLEGVRSHSVDLIGRTGKLYEEGSYRDLQLAFAFEL